MLADKETIDTILRRYGFGGEVTEIIPHLEECADGFVKSISSVILSGGQRLIVKILWERSKYEDLAAVMERQSQFSERMRAGGIPTPRKYLVDGRFHTPIRFQDVDCLASVEDWCGEEVKTITPALSYRIGALMARMHTLSLESGLRLDCETLFSAAYDNDVDAWPQFEQLAQSGGLNQALVQQIRGLHDKTLARIRAVWEILPKCAVQGDVSVNNLVFDGENLTIFDYNNAGDEVPVGDLILEGLLTAFEMDLPEGVPESSREGLFDEFLRGYLSVRTLTPSEADVAWDIYTLYHSLWFTRIVYNENARLTSSPCRSCWSARIFPPPTLFWNKSGTT